MGMWAAVTGAVMVGSCLGALYTSLLHIAKREDAEAHAFAGDRASRRAGTVGGPV